ncbi:Stp1/IreP family PP2C-type Ser/Thr phosphatase [Jeotgalibacillus proteolyticus]|uniref:protein-serine/threonine phosphatase n=1 Tax=Jeotgalibacillus proteolyticus TaxID=2082395 RepID=A0A2S5GGE3_9BACL|nr:Stp1/IreP family PP2C-type Ser/Thr phosphatase [Jeotgalibacillus proteolyticus]PPA72100.1 Stp1/IreP family PP2C-type Ser/Thr phosphatase [Jeotgalibacillus proteolyticus]
MHFAFISDQGKVRQLNEDAGGVYINPSGQLLAVVADGMGGHRAGDVASLMAVEKIEKLWATGPEISKPVEAEKWLKSSIEEINKVLYNHSIHHADCEGMGTTIVAAICTREFVTLGNVGDSRGYIVSEQKIRQITEDHSFVNALVQSGEISKSDAEHHPRKNLLLKSLGSNGLVNPTISTITVEEGDIILLCSDGLSNKIDEQLMAAAASQTMELQQRASKLVNQANLNGGEDNITIAIVEYSSVKESEGI